jgi:DNA-directed RNA polymerase alpha subunit
MTQVQTIQYTMNRTIEACDLSFRTTNALRFAKIQYLSEILALSEEDFLKLPGMCKKTFDEVKVYLEKHNLKFVQTVMSQLKILDVKIKDCGLSIRPACCLIAGDIHYIRELITFSDNELLCLINLGRKSLNEIKEFLA